MTNDKEQLQFCEILDNWYIECKGQFKGVHPLGMRKEDLKDLVCKWIETKKFFNKNPTDVQAEMSKYKADTEKYKIDMKTKLEELKHKNILEEIQAMKNAKIKSFVRYVPEEAGDKK